MSRSALLLSLVFSLQGCVSAPPGTRQEIRDLSVAWFGATPGYRVCESRNCPGPSPKTPLRGNDASASRTEPDTHREAAREVTYLVHFAHNSSILPTGFAAQAARIAARAIGHVRITGYTDSTGEADYNQWLALRRARAVRDALVARGVPADRIAVEGRGYCCYVQPNSSAEGRQANRRAEIIVTYATRNQGGSS